MTIWATALLALGLVLLLEGLVYVLAPSLIEDMLRALRELPPEARRMIGALMMVLGLLLVWGARRLAREVSACSRQFHAAITRV